MSEDPGNNDYARHVYNLAVEPTSSNGRRVLALCTRPSDATHQYDGNVPSTIRLTELALVVLLALILVGEFAAMVKLPLGISGGAFVTVTTAVAVGSLLAVNRVLFRTAIPSLYWLLTGITILTGISSANLIPGAQQVTSWLLFLLAYLTATTLSQSNKGRLVANSITFVAAVWALVLLGANIAQAIGLELAFHPNRPTALTLAIMSSVPIARATSRRSWRAATLALVLIVAVLSSNSRMAAASIVAVGLLCMGMAVGMRPMWLSKFRIALAAIAIGGVALTLMLTPFGSRLVATAEQLPVAITEANQGELRGLTQGRSYVWQELLNRSISIKSNWVVGSGAGSAAYLTADITAPETWDHPHNEYIRILIDYGAIGLLVFLIAFVLRPLIILYARVRILMSHSISRERFMQYAGATAAFLILCATDNPLSYPYAMVALGLVLGESNRLESTQPHAPITQGAHSV